MRRATMGFRVIGKVLRTWNSLPSVISRSIHLKPKVSYLPFSEVPAARRLPLIGTTLDLIVAGSAPKLHKFVDSRHQHLGPIFREPLGSIDAVFLSCPKMMRSVFLYEGQYPTHPVPDAWVIYNRKHECKRGLFFMNGEEWFNNRRLMNPLLLNGNECRLKGLTSMATQNTINLWKDACENVTGYYEIGNLENTLYRWSIDVILFIMLGEIYDRASRGLCNMIEEFAGNVFRIFEDSSKLMTFSAKLAEFLKLDSWKQFESSVSNVMELGNEIIHQSLVEFPDGKGLLSEMLQCKMDLNTVKRIFLDLIIAAGDTTTFASIWALYSLATNNNIQEQVRSQTLFDEESARTCIKRLIRETLRLYPVAPFIGRFLAKDAVIGGYEIPKGTLVLLSLYTSGRDESNFANASTFNPNRWLRSENGELCGVFQAYGTVPFGLGGRSCIGRKIAMLQMQSLIESMLTNFNLICLNEKPADIVLRLVAVPDTKIRLAIKLRH